MNRLLLFVLILTFASATLSAQGLEKSNASPALLLHFGYGYEWPGGDMSELYGSNARTGLGIEIMTGKRNLIFGLDGALMFGNTLKQDVLATLRTPAGGIIGNDKVYADIILKERGFQASALVGKLFSFSKDATQRSGIRATLGVGLLQHKVRIQEDFRSEVPQVEGEYAKGYDKLTNGLMLQEFIGYQFLGANRLINFYIGVELTQGFTQNRRDWDFVERRKIDEPRKDLLFGLRAAWTLPLYFNENADNIEY